MRTRRPYLDEIRKQKDLEGGWGEFVWGHTREGERLASAKGTTSGELRATGPPREVGSQAAETRTQTAEEVGA